MTQEEILEYNKRCADFLGWKLENGTTCLYFHDKRPIGQTWDYKDMRYHSDWNWIMEVLQKITSTGYNWELIDFNGTAEEEEFMRCSIFNLDITKPLYKFKSTSSDAKKAVVETINQFLIWHEENKS